MLHIRCRTGSANTARGALRFVEELIARVERAGVTGPKLLRADSGFWNKKIIARLQTAGWSYSIGVRQQQHIRAAIAAIDETAWQPLADYPEDGEAQIAETILGADQRLVVRRTRLIGKAGRAVARLAPLRVSDQPHRADRARRVRAPPARRRRASDPATAI